MSTASSETIVFEHLTEAGYGQEYGEPVSMPKHATPVDQANSKGVIASRENDKIRARAKGFARRIQRHALP